MTTIHASRPLDLPHTPPAAAPAAARAVAPATRAVQDGPAGDPMAADWSADHEPGAGWPADHEPAADWPADHEPAAPAASVLTAGLSLVAVLAVCAGAAVVVGFAFRAVLGFFAS